MGKRPEFMPGEKVGEAREPFQALRLSKRLSLRSVGTSNVARDAGRGNRSKTYRRPESGMPFLCCLDWRFEDMIKIKPTERVKNGMK